MRCLTAVALFLAAAVSEAAAFGGNRVAVVIGNDVGEPSDARLRYARADARRMADILVAVGDVAPQDLILVEEGPADAVRAAIAEAERRLSGTNDGLLIAYYSGHADAEALHLDGTRLPLRELQGRFRNSQVATRLLIIDACQSGALTTTKGGTAAGRFPAPNPVEASPRGFAIVSSGAPARTPRSQTRLALPSSPITSRPVCSARRTPTVMAASRWPKRSPICRAPHDGQHRFHLGRSPASDLSHQSGRARGPGAGPSRLDGVGTALRLFDVDRAGDYVVRRDGGTLIAEIASDAVNRPLALRAGRYEVTRRAPDHLLTGVFVVSAGARTGVTAARMRRLEYGQAVRKGGTAATAVTSLYATGGYRGSLLGLGGAPSGGVGARLDLRKLSATLSLDLAVASIQASRGRTLTTSELGLRAGVYRAFELSRLDIAVGAEIGGGRFSSPRASNAGRDARTPQQWARHCCCSVRSSGGRSSPCRRRFQSTWSMRWSPTRWPRPGCSGLVPLCGWRGRLLLRSRDQYPARPRPSVPEALSAPR